MARRPYYYLLPATWQRETALKWLKRAHAWLGLWGAVFGLLFGVTGILMNHRSVMKIPGPASMVDQATVQIDSKDWAEPGDFVTWAQKFLRVEKSPSQLRVRDPETIRFEGIEFKPAPQWSVLFSAPGKSVRATHNVGSNEVDLRKTEHNMWSMFIRIHKADGLSVAWILIADTIAGCFIILSLTGLLFWSRLHGPRLAGALVIIGSTSIGVWAIVASGY